MCCWPAKLLHYTIQHARAKAAVSMPVRGAVPEGTDSESDFDDDLPREVSLATLREMRAWQNRTAFREIENKCFLYKFHFDRDEPLMAKVYKGSTKYTKQEVEILLNLNHKNLLSIQAAIVGTDEVDGKTKIAKGIITPAYPLDLEEHITDTPAAPLDFNAIMRYMDLLRGIAHGLRRLHSMRIMHRDLKPSNIFLEKVDDDTYIPKIADFETARLVPPKNKSKAKNTDVTHLYATVKYLAPEACAQCHGLPSDIWSFGLIAGKLFTKQGPFEGVPGARDIHMTRVLGDPSKLQQVMDPYDNESCIQKLPIPVRDVMELCLKADPAKRPTAHELCAALRKACVRLSHMPPPVEKLYRVIYASQHDFYAGIYAKDPNNHEHTVDDHIRDGSIESRFVSTTTLLEWALWYACKIYVTTGYIENRFIVEIDVKKLSSYEHVKFHNKRAKKQSQLKGQFANFSVSAQEVCLETGARSGGLPVVPRDCITAVYRLPVETDAKGLSKKHKIGHDGNCAVHILDLKHSTRTEFICAGLYVCTQFESFKNWIELFLRAFNGQAKAALLEAMATSKEAVDSDLKMVKRHNSTESAADSGLAALRDRLYKLGAGTWANKMAPMAAYLDDILRRRSVHWRAVVGEAEEDVDDSAADVDNESVADTDCDGESVADIESIFDDGAHLRDYPDSDRGPNSLDTPVKKGRSKGAAAPVPRMVLDFGDASRLVDPKYNQRIRGKDEGYYFAVGFKSQRSAPSYKTEGSTTRLLCEIVVGAEGPVFKITADDDKDNPCLASRASTAVRQMLNRARRGNRPSGPRFFQLPKRREWLIHKGLSIDDFQGAPEFNGPALEKKSRASLIHEDGNMQLWVSTKKQRDSKDFEDSTATGVFVDPEGTKSCLQDKECRMPKGQMNVASLRKCVQTIWELLYPITGQDMVRKIVIYCNDGTFFSLVVASAVLMCIRKTGFPDSIKTLMYDRRKNGIVASSKVKEISTFNTLHYSELLSRYQIAFKDTFLKAHRHSVAEDDSSSDEEEEEEEEHAAEEKAISSKEQVGVLAYGIPDARNTTKYGRYQAVGFKSATIRPSYTCKTLKTRYVCEIKESFAGGPLIFTITADDDPRHPMVGHDLAEVMSTFENLLGKKERSRIKFFQLPKFDEWQKHARSALLSSPPTRKTKQKRAAARPKKVPRKAM